MSVSSWLMGCVPGRGKAMFLYKQGMAKAHQHDHHGAIDDYTTLIDLPGTASDLLAMVLYNRALVFVALGDEKRGAADLSTVLAMDAAQANVKTMARQKLARMKYRDSKCHA